MGRTLRLMSFNIRYFNPADGANAWPHRIDLVAATITRFDPDVLGLQEVLHGQLQDLRPRLADYAWFGVGRTDGKQVGEYAPVFYRRDRFALADAGTWWLSPTPDQPGSKGWDAQLPRIATWAVLHDRAQDDRPLFIVNTHFDHVGAAAREASAELLLRKLADVGEPCVVMGDLNCADDSPPIRALAREFVDSYRLTHAADPEEATFHGFRGGTTGHRIDFIFTRGLEVIEAEIDRSHDNGRYPSDHYPVTAVVGA